MVSHVFLCLAVHIFVCPPKLRIQHDPTEANGSALGGMRNNSGACVGKEPVDHPPMVPPQPRHTDRSRGRRIFP
jgi:hypothetical protein